MRRHPHAGASVILIPQIEQEGKDAALRGGDVHQIGAPMGFAFCPYPMGTTEHWNFIRGCVLTYFEGDVK